MAKRLTSKQKEEISSLFSQGKTINELAQKFNCTKLTISRNLKKYLGEKKYKYLASKESNNSVKSQDKNIVIDIKNNKYINDDVNNSLKDSLEEESSPLTHFFEITPLNCEITSEIRRDFSSIPISDINFPNIVYMIVDKKIELQSKYLRDYPQWQFLSQEELNRKTIEIHVDLKIAKRSCRKEEKVIKVPNTDVFKIVAPILLNKGISRIVSAGKLIAL